MKQPVNQAVSQKVNPNFVSKPSDVSSGKPNQTGNQDSSVLSGELSGEPSGEPGGEPKLKMI